MIKHTWSVDPQSTAWKVCKVCGVLKRETWDDKRQRTVQEYSSDGVTWVPRRSDCGTPLPLPEEASAPRAYGKTTGGGQIYEVRIRNSKERFFRAGVGFENVEKGYVKVEMYAVPFGEPWDGVLYLFPVKDRPQ